MKQRSIRRLLPALASVAVLALALSAVALAATPKNGTYGGSDISLTVKKHKITEVTGGAGYKCNAIPIDLKKKIKVKKGKFHFAGKVNNVVGNPAGKLTLNGKFKTTKKATGTYKLVKGSCSTGKRKFTATFGNSVG
jgi:hypothetical protein